MTPELTEALLKRLEKPHQNLTEMERNVREAAAAIRFLAPLALAKGLDTLIPRVHNPNDVGGKK